MLQLEEQPAWSPSDYHTPVHTALTAYCDAQHMHTDPEAKNRCVRVTYANLMHVDVVPYVDLAADGECIINTDDDAWEDTDPDGFTAWMQKQDTIANGNMRRVLRLLKYLRDHRDYYEDTKSIILTTIVGNVIDRDKTRAHPGCYDNVPKSLHRITNDLADWVRYQATRPDVADPSRAEAYFTHRWPQPEYDAFRRDIQIVADLVNDAINSSTSWSDSTLRWQELFGPKFGTVNEEQTSSKFPATGGAAAAGAEETTTGRTGRAG